MPTVYAIGLCMYAQMLLLVLYCTIDATEAGSVSASPEQKKRKCDGGGVDDKCFVHP